MCVNGPVLRSVVVVLLLASVSSNKRRCNYSEIVRSYKKVIFIELQQLNQSSSFNTTKEKARCPSEKQWEILRSIYGMTQRFFCPGSSQGGMDKPVDMMRQLIRQSCTQSCTQSWEKTQRPCLTRKKKRRIIRVLRNCWEKLLSLYTPEE